MSVTALITAYSPDLLTILLRSMRLWVPSIQPLVLATRDEAYYTALQLGVLARSVPVPRTINAGHHAFALDWARRTPVETDYVLVLDEDVAIRDAAFLTTLYEAFRYPVIGAWGAQGIRDAIHASCFATRRELWAKITTCQGALPLHDTLGLAQQEIQSWGYGLEVVPRKVAPEGWEVYRGLWAHLGGGVVHARASLPRRAVRRVRALLGDRRARKVIAAAQRRDVWVQRWGQP